MAFRRKEAIIAITPPNIQIASFKIVGTAPLVQNKFSQRALEAMAKDQIAGGAKKRAKREPKDFDLCFKEAIHFSEKGWAGIPASAFRAGLVSTCRLLNFPMTRAKLTLFIVPDGYERNRFGIQPLVKTTNRNHIHTHF